MSCIRRRINGKRLCACRFEASIVHSKERDPACQWVKEILGLELKGWASTHGSEEAQKNIAKYQVLKVTTSFQRGNGMDGCGETVSLWASS